MGFFQYVQTTVYTKDFLKAVDASDAKLKLSLTSADITENTRLYYTDTRVDSRISGHWFGVANGLATLDGSGKIPLGQLPSTTILDTFVVGSQAAMLALAATVGDVAVRTDQSKTYILQTANPTILGNWQELLTASVASVNGATGTITLTTDNVAEGSTNKYWTNARTLSSTLTAYASGSGTVSSSDTVLTALQKLDGTSLKKASNLSDLANIETAKTNLSLGLSSTAFFGGLSVNSALSCSGDGGGINGNTQWADMELDATAQTLYIPSQLTAFDNLSPGAIILISGCAVSGNNGYKTVKSVDTGLGTVHFIAGSIASTETVANTGITKTFHGINLIKDVTCTENLSVVKDVTISGNLSLTGALTVSGSATLSTGSDQFEFFGSGANKVVRKGITETLSNKTLNTPIISGAGCTVPDTFSIHTATGDLDPESFTACGIYFRPEATSGDKVCLVIVGGDDNIYHFNSDFDDPYNVVVKYQLDNYMPVGGGTIAGATTVTNSFTVSPTWNSGGTTFEALVVNATDTASASASKLINAKVAGTSKFSVEKTGIVNLVGGGRIRATGDIGLYSTTGGNILFRDATDVNSIFGVNLTSGTVSLFNSSTARADLLVDAANSIQIRNSTNACRFVAFNTYTSSTNYESFVLDWKTTANVLRLGTDKGSGGGTARVIQFIIGGTNAATLDSTFTLTTVGGLVSGTDVTAASTGKINFTSRSAIKSGADGTITLTNNAGSGFTALTFGDTTTASPALAKNSAELDVKLGDLSTYANLNAAVINTQIASGTGLKITNGTTAYLTYTGAGSIRFVADGVISLRNNAGSGFTKIQLGGTTSTYLALDGSTNGLKVKLADDSAFTTVEAKTFYNSSSAITPSGGFADVDFGSDGFRTVSIAANTTFTTSSRLAGRQSRIKLTADSSTRNLTFPAWKFVGGAAPANIAANKNALLELLCFGPNDTDIIAKYGVEP